MNQPGLFDMKHSISFQYKGFPENHLPAGKSGTPSLTQTDVTPDVPYSITRNSLGNVMCKFYIWGAYVFYGHIKDYRALWPEETGCHFFPANQLQVQWYITYRLGLNKLQPRGTYYQLRETLLPELLKVLKQHKTNNTLITRTEFRNLQTLARLAR